MEVIEGEMSDTNTEVQSSMTSPDVKPSIVKPGSMVMMNVTVEDYEQELWPKLSNAINQLLTSNPGEYVPLSYEQVYSCVYKCVCKQFSERLYSDLLQQITQYLQHVSQQLLSFDSTKLYIEKFSATLERYTLALQGIVPVFNYMNRFYVESKLKTDLLTELQKLFIVNVSDPHLLTLLSRLDEVHSHPFSVSPAVLSSLIKNLYALKPEYAQLRVQLFARYIPNVLPPCSLSDLDHYRQEVQQMKRDLLTHPDFISGDQGRKRLCDQDFSRVLLSEQDSTTVQYTT